MVSEKRLLEAHIKHGVKALNIYDRCPKVNFLKKNMKLKILKQKFKMQKKGWRREHPWPAARTPPGVHQ
jgi:hypothetical protein